MEFIVYSKPDCVYCELAKGLLNKYNIKYEVKKFTDLTSLSGQYVTIDKIFRKYILSMHLYEHILN